jgi:hypothetical protein
MTGKPTILGGFINEEPEAEFHSTIKFVEQVLNGYDGLAKRYLTKTFMKISAKFTLLFHVCLYY